MTHPTELSASFPESGPEVDGTGPAAVFVGGAARSGEAWLGAALARHPSLAVGRPLQLVPTVCAARSQWQASLGQDLAAAGVDDDVLDGAVRGFVAGLLLGMAGGRRPVDTTAHALLHASLLARLFPSARFVHVVRDPRAVAASLMRDPWQDPGTRRPIWYARSPADAGRYWNEVVRAVRAQAAMLPGRFVEVRAEDLAASPRAEMARVLAFLGEPWHEAVLDAPPLDPAPRLDDAAAEEVMREAIGIAGTPSD